MSYIPTTKDLKVLADDIAKDGVAFHVDRLDHIASITEQAGLYPGSASILRDSDAAPVQKSRAFVIIVRNWAEISTAASRWAEFRCAYDNLVTHWDQHQKLRADGDLTQLWDSRTRLDELRAISASRARVLV